MELQLLLMEVADFEMIAGGISALICLMQELTVICLNRVDAHFLGCCNLKRLGIELSF